MPPEPRRASTRRVTELPITVRVADRMLHGTTVNLSLGGTCVDLGERLPIGTAVTTSFVIPTSERPIEVDGQVRWSISTDTGIQFEALRARAVWELNHFFETLDAHTT